MKTLTIPRRFCGPAASANGGYFAGRVATLAARTLSVRLKVPPPLDTEFTVRELPDGALQVCRGEEIIGGAAKHIFGRNMAIELPHESRRRLGLGTIEAARGKRGQPVDRLLLLLLGGNGHGAA